jgi:hypothetical protein
MKFRWAVKDRYWLMLAVTLSFALFCVMQTGIADEEALFNKALADAGDNLPYQLVVYDGYGKWIDTIYTNDYTLLPPSHGGTGLNDLHIRWGATWAGRQWQFILKPLTIDDVRVKVNTGKSIKLP